MRLSNIYGPTETTTFALSHRIQTVAEDDSTIPIGRPLRGTRAYILDRYLCPVPIGVWGQLFLAGDGLARCYQGKARQTAERFGPDPFLGEPGARLYQTGDRVRYRENGDIEFGGRLDQQVKIRGFRVELGEIEHHAREFTGQPLAAALASPGAGGAVTLSLFLEQCDVTAEQLADYLKTKLPAYMMPRKIHYVDRMPLNMNGKIDRKALEQRLGG